MVRGQDGTRTRREGKSGMRRSNKDKRCGGKASEATRPRWYPRVREREVREKGRTKKRVRRRKVSRRRVRRGEGNGRDQASIGGHRCHSRGGWARPVHATLRTSRQKKTRERWPPAAVESPQTQTRQGTQEPSRTLRLGPRRHIKKSSLPP